MACTCSLMRCVAALSSGSTTPASRGRQLAVSARGPGLRAAGAGRAGEGGGEAGAERVVRHLMVRRPRRRPRAWVAAALRSRRSRGRWRRVRALCGRAGAGQQAGGARRLHPRPRRLARQGWRWRRRCRWQPHGLRMMAVPPPLTGLPLALGCCRWRARPSASWRASAGCRWCHCPWAAAAAAVWMPP